MPEQVSEKIILVIHGPNLNLLGERDPGIYGSMTLDALNQKIETHVENSGYRIQCFQSNHEGELIDFIHENRKKASGIVINPGALTHYSYAVRDAIAAVDIPAVEVHLSDIQNREDFRQISVIQEVCLTQISGLGIQSYIKGIDYLIKRINLY